MGLRCSLLGHDYGETTTEREREEQGGEVVVVERELQECARCGSGKVLSENTEVRTLQATPDADDAESAAPEPETSEPSFSEPAETSVSAGTDSTGSTPPEHAPSADEDDAVILEDEPGEDREPGQWPDEAQQEAMTETADTGEPEPEPTPWPDQAGEDEGFDAKPASETEDDGEDDAFEFGGGLTPESADPGEAGDEGYVEAPTETEPPADFSHDTERGQAGGSDTMSPTDAGQSGSTDYPGSEPQSGSTPSGAPAQSGAAEADGEFEDSGFTSAGPVNPPSGSTDDSDTLLVCPECGFERKAARASLRAGDICPECRKGYLAERR